MPSGVVTALTFIVLIGLLWLFLRTTVLGRGFSVPLKTMFTKPVTHEYPEKPKPPAPRFHGRHQLNRYPDGLEKCIGCELCAWACPADAIYVQGADNTVDARFSPGERYAEDYQINYNRCIFCGLCIEACPTRALTMIHDYEIAEDSRDALVYTKLDLIAPVPDSGTLPPHTDKEVRERGINYYGGMATSPPTLAGGEYEQAAPAPSARAASVIPEGPWGGGGSVERTDLPAGPEGSPPDIATVGRSEDALKGDR